MNGFRYLSIFIKGRGKSILWGVIIGLVLGPASAIASSTGQSGKPIEGGIAKKKGDISVGKRVYNKYCHYCHGMEGRGDGAIAIGLTPHPANFVADVDRMKKGDQELFESISKGIHREIGGDELAMPQWNLILTEDEIWSVLAYVRYLSEKGRTEDAKDRKNR